MYVAVSLESVFRTVTVLVGLVRLDKTNRAGLAGIMGLRRTGGDVGRARFRLLYNRHRLA
jgi:hypothetical protein